MASSAIRGISSHHLATCRNSCPCIRAPVLELGVPASQAPACGACCACSLTLSMAVPMTCSPSRSARVKLSAHLACELQSLWVAWKGLVPVSHSSSGATGLSMPMAAMIRQAPSSSIVISPYVSPNSVGARVTKSVTLANRDGKCVRRASEIPSPP